MPTRSPLRSSAGPDVTRTSVPISWPEQVRERGLAEPGRPRQQHVVERVAALARRLDVDRQVLGDLALARRTRRRCAGAAPRRRRPGRSSRCASARDHAPACAAPRVRCRLRSVVVAFSRHVLSPPQRRQSLFHQIRGRPRGVHVVEQRLELVRPEAERRPARRTRRRAVPSGRPRARGGGAGTGTPRPAGSVVIFSRSSTVSRSAILRPTPLICVRRATSPPAIARTSSPAGSPARIASATRGPTPWTSSSVWNRRRSSASAKP